MSNRAFVIDVSTWQDYYDADVLKRAGGKAVIIKASMGYGRDPKVMQHVATAKAANLPFGLYHWGDPTASVGSQAEILASCIRQFSPNFVMIDVEQWWKSWNDWYRWQNGEITREEVGTFTDREITANADGIINYIRNAFPGLYVLMYTASWFTWEYCHSLCVLDVPLALADYRGFGPRRFIQPEEMPAIIESLENTTPLMPPNATTWEIHQFSDNIVIDGLTGSIVDCNRTNLPWEEFAKLIGVVVEPPTPPEPPVPPEPEPPTPPIPDPIVIPPTTKPPVKPPVLEPPTTPPTPEPEKPPKPVIPPAPTPWKVKITAWPGLWVRTRPINGDRIGGFMYGSVVEVIEKDLNGWLRLASKNAWISGKYTKKI